MEKDAVSAGVSEIGGLFSTAEIRILICYVISSIGQPVPGRMLADVLHYEGIANVFEVNDSIASLCESGQIKFFSEKEDTYVITESGNETEHNGDYTCPLSQNLLSFLALLGKSLKRGDSNRKKLNNDGCCDVR